MNEIEKGLENYLPNIPKYKPAIIGDEKPQLGYDVKIIPYVKPKLGDLKVFPGYG